MNSTRVMSPSGLPPTQSVGLAKMSSALVWTSWASRSSAAAVLALLQDVHRLDQDFGVFQQIGPHLVAEGVAFGFGHRRPGAGGTPARAVAGRQSSARLAQAGKACRSAKGEAGHGVILRGAARIRRRRARIKERPRHDEPRRRFVMGRGTGGVYFRPPSGDKARDALMRRLVLSALVAAVLALALPAAAQELSALARLDADCGRAIVARGRWRAGAAAFRSASRCPGGCGCWTSRRGW